jgi:amidase
MDLHEGESSMPEQTIRELQEGLAHGEYTARELAEDYLRRIAEIDQAGPTLRSVIEINPDALAIAGQLDAERRAHGPRGPLHGIPVLLKDNIDTGDHMLTTAGSLALAGKPAAQDAGVAAKLRAAGALILGKTNLSEWANFRGEHSSSGWSSRGGQTRNPYALDRSPCGSSSGSGVAVAANLCAAAIGTETDGSIVCPSHICGIVGIKPTLGLLSRAGIVPIAHSQDTAGPMARSVADAAALLGSLTGEDPRDVATLHRPGPVYHDYTAFLDPAGLRGARIGVARNLAGFDGRVDAVLETALAALRDLGAEVVDPVEIVLPKELDEHEMAVLLYEYKADLDAYLAARGATAAVHSLADVIAFNKSHAAETMPFFGQELMEQAEEKGPLTDEAYLAALAACRRMARDEGIDAVLHTHQLDALVAPTGGVAWLIDHVTGDHYTGGNSTPAAVAGYPSITVPMGYVYGLPVGLSFIGAAYTEARLIRYAYAFEHATQVRRPPEFTPSIEL